MHGQCVHGSSKKTERTTVWRDHQPSSGHVSATGLKTLVTEDTGGNGEEKLSM